MSISVIYFWCTSTIVMEVVKFHGQFDILKELCRNTSRFLDRDEWTQQPIIHIHNRIYIRLRIHDILDKMRQCARRQSPRKERSWRNRWRSTYPRRTLAIQRPTAVWFHSKPVLTRQTTWRFLIFQYCKTHHWLWTSQHDVATQAVDSLITRQPSGRRAFQSSYRNVAASGC